jgi:hypothetical protein
MCAREILFKFAVKYDKVLGVRKGFWVSIVLPASSIAFIFVSSSSAASENDSALIVLITLIGITSREELCVEPYIHIRPPPPRERCG